jgi:unsaturated chondroitin disaccharide hydrolase
MLAQGRSERYRRAIEFAGRQVAAEIDRQPDRFPMYTTQGRWPEQSELWTDWTGGFFVGLMWKLFVYTGDDVWRARAERYSRLLEHRQYDRDVHDLGFIFLNSYLPWYELTGDKALQSVVIQAGRTLAMRFVEPGEYLHSFLGRESLFIDIMMNVPIIFYAAQATGDAELARIALAHSRTTAKYLIRDDGSAAHEAIFDLPTGQYLRQSTQQGLADDTAWARGLAWSLYGFSTVYRYTKLPEFLEVAERNARYFTEHLPDDHVPYWDFCADLSAPLPWGAQKDSSAGAIAASGLLDLAQQTDNPRYSGTAVAILDALCEPHYLADSTPGWEGILKHGVYHTRKGLGVDESVMWGEFFFVEALLKALTL